MRIAIACLFAACIGCTPEQKPCPPPAPPTATSTPPAPLAPGMAQALYPQLATMAQRHVPASHAIGPAFGAVFQQGQRVEQPLLLEPRLCYSVLAIGSGVTELDLSLGVYTAPGIQPLGQDTNSGAEAQLGPGDRCVTIPAGSTAVLAQVVLSATGGNGPALAQIYAR
jgi:hypothetical protein